jgi:hypothetical protein
VLNFIDGVNMKSIISLLILLLTVAALPTFAHDNEDAKECFAKSKAIVGTHEQVEFLSNCLKEIDPTAFELGERVERCNQNAINKKLEGQKKDEYLEKCYSPQKMH